MDAAGSTQLTERERKRERERERERYYICSSHLGLMRWRIGIPQGIEQSVTN